MSDIKEVLRRKEIFDNLDQYLKEVKKAVQEIDDKARMFLFGSVARGNWTYSSDIDILVVSEKRPGEIIYRLYKKGFSDPFEFHIIKSEKLQWYIWYNEGHIVEI